jgi:hypothetical protein
MLAIAPFLKTSFFVLGHREVVKGGDLSRFRYGGLC